MFKITVKAARVNAGLTQKAAAKDLGVSNVTLCKWENGTAVPNVRQVEDICHLYGVPYDFLNFFPNNPLKAESQEASYE